jgi:predicted lipoprotein with Yx(FWY)xxD motif
VVGAVTLAVVAMFAAMALAASSAAPTVRSATNAKFSEMIVVDAHGQTLYALSPETAHHLLCKSSECLKVWPPLTVRSRKTKLMSGSGVHGHLGILRRSNGMLQVTLRGLPVYHFSGDSAKGAANGESIKSFGGTWHVISAGSNAIPAPSSTETTPSYPSPSTTPSTPTSSTPAPTTPTTPTTTPTTTTPTTPTYTYPPGY